MRSMTQLTFALPAEMLAPEDLRHNKLKDVDRAFHDWYRFVLSYPPHLVSDHFARFESKPGDLVQDPFCGTGTTLTEATKNGSHPNRAKRRHEMAERIAITFETGNAAFENSPTEEIGRILCRIADDLRDYGDTSEIIRDANENTVGTVRIDSI